MGLKVSLIVVEGFNMIVFLSLLFITFGMLIVVSIFALAMYLSGKVMDRTDNPFLGALTAFGTMGLTISIMGGIISACI
jgi:hypothetical protein